ncbi:hypothetical protein LSCM1_07037 [Leishmania martiniquensis]|uniref:Uncharacterized protein n=1 Tax=Leishmania martiniquensis TaxID=1580590 RepID=A0A836HVE0_9TRYP|nr:hypothetical protein LSCM1_07037 [Leishmania martiniquensis]
MSSAVTVHPLVLLSIVDHITRASLQQQLQKQEKAPAVAAPSPLTPVFMPTAGLLMGTTKVSAPADVRTRDHAGGTRGITTSLSASFELPLRLRPPDGVLADVAPSGDAAFLQRVLSDETDWLAAQKHREQLSAVMPEMDIVGCYVVCAGSRWTSTRHQEGDDHVDGAPLSIGGAAKKAKGESAVIADDGIVAIAKCVERLLRRHALLPSMAVGLALLIVYDEEVTSAAGEVNSAAPGLRKFPAAGRLPFDCLFVPSTTVRDQLRTEEVAVCPTDMEWIALANETVTPAHHQSVEAAPPLSIPPSLLRRLCNAAYSTSVGAARAARELTHTQAPLMASSQNSRAAEELVGSLRLIMRLLSMLTASPTNPIVTTPEDVELLRTVATCLRNVPDSSPSPSHGEQTTLCALPTEEVLRAVLAVEVQCALRLCSLRKAQPQVLRRSPSATAALHP